MYSGVTLPWKRILRNGGIVFVAVFFGLTALNLFVWLSSFVGSSRKDGE